MTYLLDLPNPVPSELREEFLKRICYLSEDLESYDFLPESLSRFQFVLRSGTAEQYGKVSTGIRDCAKKLSDGYRPGGAKLIGRTTGRGTFSTDPHPALERLGELFPYGKGRAGLGPEMCRLVEIFESEIKSLASRFGAITHQFPALIGADLLERCRYIRSFPSSLTFVSHLREDNEIAREFVHDASCSMGALHCKPEHLSAQECLLSPNVCFHCYGWFAGRDIKAPLTITACGKCFRYESKNLTGLERLWDFTMREIIFVGPAEWVLAERQKAIEMVLDLMEKWGLACEIRSANDPFFTDDFAAMATYQQAFDLKFELLLPLPYKNKSLAVGSFNSHQDFFGRVFQITHQGQTAYTTCVGFGLERLLLAFLAQYGIDRKSWPPQFR